MERQINSTESAATAAAPGSRQKIMTKENPISTPPRSQKAHTAQLAAIVSSSGDAIISVAIDWTVLTWNPGAEKLFGYITSEVVGRQIEDLILPQERRLERETLFDEVVRQQRTVTLESIRHRKDGRQIEVEINSAPMINADGEVFAASLIYRDVSRRNREQRRALAQAQRLADIKVAIAAPNGKTSLPDLRPITGIVPETRSLAPLQLIDDPERLAAIAATGLLAQPSDNSFDRFTSLARQIIDAPIALMTLMLPDRQVIVSTNGLSGDLEGITRAPLSQSFCQHVVTSGAPVIIKNASKSALVLSPGLSENGLMAYLGVPLITTSGEVLGSFCVLDARIRDWTTEELSAIEGLAGLVSQKIENQILIHRLEKEISVRAETEAKLRQSQQRNEMAAKAAHIGFWDVDLNTDTYTATPEDFAHYGLPPTSEPVDLNNTVRRLYLPEDRERIRKEIDEAVRKGERLVQEKRIRRSDGEIRWLQSITEIRHDTNGKPVSRYGATLDITDAKLAQEQLAASEDKFRRMADNVPIMMWMHGTDGKQEFVNQGYCDYFGVTRAEMRNDRWQLLAHPEAGTAYIDAFAAAVKTQTPFHHEIRVRNGAGEWRWLESWGRPHFSKDGTYLGHIGASIDISENKSWDAALEASASRLRKVIDTAQVGIGFGNRYGQLIQANAALLDLLGRSEDELIHGAIDWHDHHLPPAAARSFKKMSLLQTEGHLQPFETIIIGEQNREVPVLISASMINASTSEYVMFVVDLTQQKQHEQQIELLMQEVNHRSKNLLAVVQSLARQTAKDADPSVFIEDFSRRLQGLSRSQDLIIDGKWTAVGLTELAQSQLHFLGDRLHTRIDISGPDVQLSPPAVQGIGMAFHELATNALKYGALSTESGRISITWEHTRSDGENSLEIRWVESHGPTVRRPKREGFGHTVIQTMAAYAVGGTVDLRYDASGLKWTLTAPERKDPTPDGRRY